MKNYGNYLMKFEYLPYLEKIKYGEWTGKFNNDGFLIYKPMNINDFERKMLLDIGFDTKWNIDK